MAGRSSQSGKVWRGICLGLASTLIVAGLHFTSSGRMAEVWWLDLCFRNLPTLQAGEQILHVDLDDKALEQIGRWPWPRRRLAQLVEVLNGAGARAVVLDTILPEPEEPRFVRAGATDLYAADTGALVGADAPPVLVLDDAELAEAIAAEESPRLFLAMHVDIERRPVQSSPRQKEADALAAEVATRPALTVQEAAARLNVQPARAGELLSAAREAAFEKRVAALLTDRPDRSLREVLHAVLGQAEPGTENFQIVRRAYLRRRALEAIRRFALPGPPAEAPIPPARAVPPLVTLGEVIAHTGFVTVEPDGDGILRRTPLLARTEVGVFPQMVLAVAAEVFAGEHGGRCDVSARPGAVVLTCPDGFVRGIPVDSTGSMRINWVRPAHAGAEPRHVSAVAAASVWEAREGLRRNGDLARLACLRMAEILGLEELLDLAGEADSLWQDLQDHRLKRQQALLFAPGEVPPPAEDIAEKERQLERQIEQACRRLIEDVDSFYLPSATLPAAGGKENEQVRSLREWHSLLRRIEQENAALVERLAEASAEVRRLVQGKICLVGSTATGAPDFVPTPVHQRVPGVVVHANVLETILSGRFVRGLPGWSAAALVLLAGALVSLVTSTRGPIESAILLVAAIVGYVLVASGLWLAWTIWIVAAGPISAMLLAFAVVTVYRQLTEERQKRQITKTFKQYLSPAMVDRLLADPTQASLGGQQRQLSCLFSDLAGFTSLSERLGPEGTVNLLNRYLDRIGEIVQVRHGGTLSKYEGDGVFAFFGAPVAQADHAARALVSALECQEILPEFNRSLRAERVLPEGTELAVRIGITSGEVFVGNMGSTQRIAYTAIGDSVNLASRLETANKQLGTLILVNEEAWRSGGAGLLGRPVGRVLVVGKSEPVAVWEPLARDGSADDSLRRLADDFARGIEAYAAAGFRQAAECFRAILQARDDAPARFYLRLCEEALSWPPGKEDFDGVLRLTEK